MRLNIFLLMLGICFGMIFYNKVLVKPIDKKIDNVFVEIDTVFYERERYVKDTVFVKQKIVVDHYDTISKKVDSIFQDTSVENKQKLFDSVYPTSLYDSFRILEMTNSQAHATIEAKYLQERDSALLDICQENVKQCDKSLTEVKVKIDTLQQLIPKENSRWKAIGLTTSGISAVLFLLFLLR